MIHAWICEKKKTTATHARKRSGTLKKKREGGNKNKEDKINGFMATPPSMIHFFIQNLESIRESNGLIKGSNGIILLLVNWRIRKMTIAFQLAVFALIATSFILLISVPVVFASPDGWSSNKNVIFSGTSLWIGLVFLVGILNSLIS